MNYEEYAKKLGARDEVINWINTVLKNVLNKAPLDQTEVEHIIDYFISDAAPKRLLKMSYDEALSNTKKWSSASQKKGRDLVDSDDDIEEVLSIDDEKIVKLKTKKALQREGFLMGHCVGDYDPERSEIYSFRDKNNNPHITFEVDREDEEVSQIKGKGNGSIHPRYIEPALKFLEHMGMTIKPHDMKNLGYIHVPEKAIHLIKQIEGCEEQLKNVRGEHYVLV